MNAYELADWLDNISVNDFESLDQHHYTREAAIMLRKINDDNVRLLKAYGEMAAYVEELKPYKEKIEAMEREYDKHFEAALRADDVWKRATGKNT